MVSTVFIRVLIQRAKGRKQKKKNKPQPVGRQLPANRKFLEGEMEILEKYLNSFSVPADIEADFNVRAGKLIAAAEQPKLEVLVWEATRRCNLQCRHCGTPFEKESAERELTTTQTKKIFNKINAAFGIKNLTTISITGGEPTVRKDLVEVVKFIRSLGTGYITMHSNGHHISQDEGYLPKLVEAGLEGIGLNIDGLEATHNWLRQNSEAFHHSVRALKIAQKLKMETMISTVITRRSLEDLVFLRNFIADLSPQRWRLIPIEPIGRAQKEDLLTPEMVAELVGFVLDTLENFPDLPVELGCGQWYGKKIEGLARPYIWHCIAGLNLMSILHDGSIGGCNNIHPIFCQGNALEDNPMEVWLNRFQVFREKDRYRLGECLDCADWDQCRGGEMHLRGADEQRLAPCFFRWMRKKGFSC